MANVIPSPSVLFDNPAGLSVNISQATNADYNKLALIASTPSAVTRNLIIPRPIFQNLNVIYGLTFGDVWFNRIHINPNPLIINSLIGTTVYQVEVWNTFTVSHTLTAIAPTTLPGITMAPGAGFPLTFNTLEAKLIPVTATLDGPPAINGLFTLTFTGLPPQILTVTGNRSFVVAFRANWSALPVERFAWKTERLPALSAKSQRIRLRQHPRRTVELSYILADKKALAVFKASLWHGQPLTFSLAEWQDASILDANASAGASALLAATIGRDFEPAKGALIWRDPFTSESVTVQSVTDGQVNLAGPIALGWRKGDYLIPLRRAVLLQEPRYKKVTATVTTATVVWDITTEEVSTWRYTAAGSLGLPVYRGLNVMEQDSEASQDLDEALPRNIAVHDPGFGIFKRLAIGDYPQPTFDYRRLLKTRAEFAAFLGWLYTLAGGITPFWSPTWTHDLQMALPALSTDNFITVDDWGYRTTYNSAAPRSHVAIYLKSGVIIRRKITGAEAGSNMTEVLSLDATLGVGVAPADVDRISYLRCCTLAGDEVQFEFETDTVMRAAVKFAELTTTP